MPRCESLTLLLALTKIRNYIFGRNFVLVGDDGLLRELMWPDHQTLLPHCRLEWEARYVGVAIELVYWGAIVIMSAEVY